MVKEHLFKQIFINSIEKYILKKEKTLQNLGIVKKLFYYFNYEEIY